MHEYIIVGAGSAGCVLANRLTENPRTRVLLIEAGPPATRRELRIPAAFGKLFKTELDWAYETEPEPALGGRRLYWPRGRVIGGSSSINAMVYTRGHPADFDGWAALGNRGWAFADVLPYFQRAERRGDEGPADGQNAALLDVRPQRNPNVTTRAFLEAARQAGIAARRDAQELDTEGAGLAMVTQRRGARWSAADAYLRPAQARSNLTVVTEAQVARVLLDGGRAIGVELLAGGRLQQAVASREVILAAGTVNSPQLLMLSGIGPAEELRAHGITVAHELPGVGRNLQDHLLCGLIVHCPRPVTLVAATTLGQLLRFLLFRRGMLTSNVAEALAFIRTAPTLTAPDVELIFAPGPYIDHGLVPPPGHAISLGVVLLQPASRGSIALRSPRAADAPVIRANYLTDDEGRDLRAIMLGFRQAQRVLEQPALSPYVGAPIEPGGSVVRDADLEQFLRDQCETLYHPVGTCRMGSDPLAVVDGELRVRGVQGLRVVDASVMPTIVRGHTHAATIMIAEKAAALIRNGTPTLPTIAVQTAVPVPSPGRV